MGEPDVTQICISGPTVKVLSLSMALQKVLLAHPLAQPLKAG
jgi:hypothetical protein